MIFRPCIDIHNGKVKQIVGSTLNDAGDSAVENFVSDRDAAYFAGLYKEYDLPGGHVIILNSKDSEYYGASRSQAISALHAYPGGLMIGGGIGPENAPEFLEEGASHVIVTSYIFEEGRISYDKIEKLVASVGADRIVIDLSCTYTDGAYHVTTNRWQTVSDETVDEALFDRLVGYCDGFLVHAVDSEGRSSGVDGDLIRILAKAKQEVCYAGGISSYDDIRRIVDIGSGKVDFTVGSRLDIFGGSLGIEEIIRCIR